MPFTDDDNEFLAIGPLTDVNGQTLIYPSAVISQVENLIILKNAHRNYSMGNLARVFTLAGCHYLIGPDDDKAYYTTEETTYQLVTKCPIYRVADRYDYAVFLDCYSGIVKVELCDDAGTVLSFVELGIGPDIRDIDQDLLTISSSYPTDDVMYLKIWLKLTPTSSTEARLYHLNICEINSTL